MGHATPQAERLSVLFMGTPDFAARVLGILLKSRHRVVGVVSQPSRPSGRGLTVEDPPAARLARTAGLPVLQPEKLLAAETLETFRGLEPDLIVTAAYGRILRPKLLGLPPRGCWNVHASLLPRHRGAAPIAAALLAGDDWTGVTIFRMDEGMDTGPLLLQRMVPVRPDSDAGSLTEELAELGGEALVEALDHAARGAIREVPQPERGATYARMLAKGDGRIRFHLPADQIDRWVRAVTPWPGAHAEIEGRRLRILKAHPEDLMPGARPGSLVPLAGGRLGVACLPGHLELLEVQAEGRRAQPAMEWFRGARLGDGARFEWRAA